MKLLTLLVFLLILNSSSHACEFQLITNEFPPFVAKLSTPFQDVLRQIRGQRILQIQQILNKSRFQINSFTPKSLNVLSDND
ncbi:MAG: hypothetical protein KDD40_11125, partial [Bdellovibrionales bacterium]|nr:hypothetical protein [Bdellovibrionales bacterium]